MSKPLVVSTVGVNNNAQGRRFAQAIAGVFKTFSGSIRLLIRNTTNTTAEPGAART